MWRVPIGIVEMIGGGALFWSSLSNRWVNWCRDKPFAIPYFVLAVAFWIFVAGMNQMLKFLTFAVAPR
jgi:hypothetical protein